LEISPRRRNGEVNAFSTADAISLELSGCSFILIVCARAANQRASAPRRFLELGHLIIAMAQNVLGVRAKDPTRNSMNTRQSISNDNASAIIANDVRTWAADPLTFRRDDAGDRTVLRIAGSLDAISTPEMRAPLDTVVAARRPMVEVDLSSLRSIDSSGVGAIVSLYKRVRAQGGSVTLQGLGGQPLAIFQLLRLDHVLAA
jgi:anti-sigma B factor antagonist